MHFFLPNITLPIHEYHPQVLWIGKSDFFFFLRSSQKRWVLTKRNLLSNNRKSRMSTRARLSNTWLMYQAAEEEHRRTCCARAVLIFPLFCAKVAGNDAGNDAQNSNRPTAEFQSCSAPGYLNVYQWNTLCVALNKATPNCWGRINRRISLTVFGVVVNLVSRPVLPLASPCLSHVSLMAKSKCLHTKELLLIRACLRWITHPWSPQE